MKRITDLIKEKRVYFDGGTGTVLQSMGLKPGEVPESWNIKYPERIIAHHRAYFEAGSNIVKTNTFGVNRDKFSDYEELIFAGVSCAREASKGFEDAYVAYDLGPLGRLLEPLGTLKFEEAVDIFAANVKVAVKAGADLILIETMNDAYETKAAVLAAKENCDLPIFATNAYDSSGKLMTGADPAAMVDLLEGLGVDALGINCSIGPDKMMDIVDKLVQSSSLPVIVNPNAGLPSVIDGKTVFNIEADEFSDYMVKMAGKGAAILGGCCGTTPEYIAKVIAKTRDMEYTLSGKKEYTSISSYTHSVLIGDDPILIGERINPTGKSKLKEALRNNDLSYILNEGIKQADGGAHVLDVNVGLPEIDEPLMMKNVIKALQAVTDLPLQIDTSDPVALEAGMRIYNGKPLVNSVNGTKKSMEAVFPVVKKYGGTLIALTIGENGIPDTAQGRVEIAEQIIERAKEYGIEKKDIIVDPLAMTISSAQESGQVTLNAIKLLKAKGIKTSLGVSNISFGLPVRDIINSVFYANALEAGLNCAIMNPFSRSMMDVYHAFRALNCFDKNCLKYMEYAQANPLEPAAATINIKSSGASATDSNSVGTKATTEKYSYSSGNIKNSEEEDLKQFVKKGLKESAVKAAESILQSQEPLEVINKCIVPALNEVGADFEAKRAFLPQLLMSADAASAAFEQVKKKLPISQTDNNKKVILATVKGDIHDIGKNIVKVLLQSYGFVVVDLGRDVDPALICETAIEQKCGLVGLSALMTTTVPSMKESIDLIRKSGCDIKVMVGGAVLTQEYADMIGADFYSEDAMGTVRYVENYYR